MAEYYRQYAVEQFHKSHPGEKFKIDMDNLIKNITIVKVEIVTLIKILITCKNGNIF